MNETYLYPYSVQEAKKRNQLPMWRESYHANVACRNAIEETIRQNFDGIVWAKRGFDFYRTIPETAYAVAYLDEFRQTDADPDTGCMEFELCKGRFAFRLTAPYSKERRRVASEAAKKNSVNRIQHCHPGEILRCIHGLSAGADGNKKSPKHRPARSASG